MCEVLEGGGSIENLDKTARIFLEHFGSLTQQPVGGLRLSGIRHGMIDAPGFSPQACAGAAKSLAESWEV